MKLSLKLALLLASGGLAGCASAVYEGRFAWQAGWRVGTVIAVGEGETFVNRLDGDCKSANRPGTSDRFATVWYMQVSRSRRWTAPIPKDSGINVDDLVYVNVFQCAAQLEKREGPARKTP
jgi:hypothetical protein